MDEDSARCQEPRSALTRALGRGVTIDLDATQVTVYEQANRAPPAAATGE